MARDRGATSSLLPDGLKSSVETKWRSSVRSPNSNQMFSTRPLMVDCVYFSILYACFWSGRRDLMHAVRRNTQSVAQRVTAALELAKMRCVDLQGNSCTRGPHSFLCVQASCKERVIRVWWCLLCSAPLSFYMICFAAWSDLLRLYLRAVCFHPASLFLTAFCYRSQGTVSYCTLWGAGKHIDTHTISVTPTLFGSSLY